jgi:tetratricopeptide (TPR) repeat protein
MLFEGAEDESEAKGAKRDLQSIVTGSGSLRKPTDRTRMILHISQMVDFQTRGEINRAAEELQRAMDIGLSHPAAFFDQGYLHAQSGRLESAMRQLQRAVTHPDYALGSRLLLGDLSRKKGLLREASLEYLEALRLADAQTVTAEQANDLRQLYEPIIESHRRNDDPDLQTRLCDNIYNMLMRPDWRIHLQRAREQLPGQSTKAIPMPLAEIILQARSGLLVESISAIHEMSSRGQLRSAMEEAFYALQHAPTYLPLHSLMGEMLYAQGNVEGAAVKFQAVARDYSVRGEAQQAINIYRRIVELAPADLGVRNHLIEQLVASGKMDNAIQEYMNLADVYLRLADLNMARKTYTDALRAAQQANLERSLRVKILFRMADIDMQSLDWRQALRIFEQIRTLQPDDQEARLNLVELNFRLGQEPQALAELDNYIAHLNSHNQGARALEFLVGLTNEHPKRVPLRRRLADLYRLLGQPKQAIEQLDTIGELLLDTGDRAGAVQTVEMILSLNPPNRGEYQQLLDQLRKG